MALAGIAGAVLLWLAASPVQAEQQIALDVMASQCSEKAGSTDPRAAALQAKLSRQFKCESLRVLEQKRMSLALDEIGSMSLPNGRELRVRPVDIGERGVLMVVRIEGTVETELRAPSGHLSVFVAGAHDGGTLIVSVQPHY